jgi:hypothetical protein
MLHFLGTCGISSSVILPSRGGLEPDRDRALGLGVDHWTGLDPSPPSRGSGNRDDAGVPGLLAVKLNGLESRPGKALSTTRLGLSGVEDIVLLNVLARPTLRESVKSREVQLGR